MYGDTNKKVIGRFANGAVLNSLINKGGEDYYTIDHNGNEVFSIHACNGEPKKMVAYYEEYANTRYLGDCNREH